MADININKTSFLSYVMNHQDQSDTITPYDTSFVTLQYKKEGATNVNPTIVTSYVGNLIHGLFSANDGYGSTVIPERVTYSVGSLSTSDYNKFYNRMHKLGEYFEQYPIITGYRYNGNNYYSHVVLNMVNGTNGNYPNVTQINFSGNDIYKRDIQLTGSKDWDDTSSVTGWNAVYWSNYSSSDQTNYVNKLNYAYNEVTGANNFWWSAINLKNLVKNCTTASTASTIVTNLGTTDRNGTAYTSTSNTSTVWNLLSTCYNRSLPLKDKNLCGRVIVENVGNNDTIVFTSLTNEVGVTTYTSSGSTKYAMYGRPICYSATIHGAANNTFKAYVNPTAYKIYNVNYAYDMAFALTYTQGNYASIKGWSYLMGLTSSSTFSDVVTALDVTDKFGKTYGTDAPSIHTLFEKCSTKSFKMKERVLQGEVQIFKLSETRYVLSGLSQLVVNGTDDNPMGVLVAYNVNIAFNDTYTLMSIPNAAPPVQHNLYNI